MVWHAAQRALLAVSVAEYCAREGCTLVTTPAVATTSFMGGMAYALLWLVWSLVWLLLSLAKLLFSALVKLLAVAMLEMIRGTCFGLGILLALFAFTLYARHVWRTNQNIRAITGFIVGMLRMARDITNSSARGQQHAIRFQ